MPLFGRKTETNYRSCKGAIIFLVLSDGAPTSVGFRLYRQGAKAAKGGKEEGDGVPTSVGLACVGSKD